MNYHLSRTRDGYLLSPERMHAPTAAQDAHPHVMDLGTIVGAQLPIGLGARCMYEVAKSSYVFIGFRDEGYVHVDTLAQAMHASWRRALS
jgi:hypothetical protein